MKNFNKRNNRNKEAEARNKEREFLDEMSKKMGELIAELEQINNTADRVQTRLGILVESKKHAQEVK